MTLVNGAENFRFIWAGRQIENLSRMKLEADVRNAMRKLPKETLNDLYEDIFNRISKAEPQACTLAMQAFSLLLCTQEPLSPKAFLQAMATTTPHHYEAMDLPRMMDICFNLIALDSELKVLRFAHVSFQEFLEMRAEFAPHRAHRVAAISCLELCLQGFPIGMEATLVPKDDFYHYSAVYWAKHCRATDAIERDDVVVGKLEEFVFDEGDIALSFLCWLEELPKFSKQLINDHPLAKDLHAVIHSGGSPLFTACVFGLNSLVDTLALTTDFDWNQKNDLGQTGLYLAAAAGHEAIVQKLLQYAPDVNPLGGKFNHPLHAACFAGYVPIVELLLDHGADPTLGPKNALECSFLGGHENITLMLLENKFEISDQADYDLILRQAAEVGYTEVVRFLQNKYAFLFGDLGSPKCKAIEAAIFKGRIGVLERQIRKAANPKTDLPSDAVAIAALGGQDVIVKLLIDSGLDIDREGPFGTPLRAASIMCHESTVRLLLKLGARLDVSGSLGDPLQAAAMRGHESITKMLLNEGANVNRYGGFYGTALQAAAHRGHQRIVEILLDAGADVHQGGFSRDSFHAASEGGHENIVRLFLESGFKVQHTLPGPRFRMSGPSPYKNLLREASPGRAKDFRCASGKQFKLEGWRERASALDFHYVFESMRGAKTPEHEAIQPYRERYRQYSRDEENYALQAAAASGHHSIVELLLAHVHTMGISNSEIMTAFKEACKNGHQKVVKLLLTSHMEVEDWEMALKAAALHGHLAVVNMLIDHEEKHGLARTHTVRSSRSHGQDRFDPIGAVPNSPNQVRQSFYFVLEWNPEHGFAKNNAGDIYVRSERPTDMDGRLRGRTNANRQTSAGTRGPTLHGYRDASFIRRRIVLCCYAPPL
jgi:ankyrin repeat protein